MMKKMFATIAVALPLLIGVPTANATHQLVPLTLGEQNLITGSVCKEEIHAISVIKTYEEQGFAASVELYNALEADQKCLNVPQPFVAIVERVVYEFEKGNARVFELTIPSSGTKYYLVTRTHVVAGTEGEKVSN